MVATLTCAPAAIPSNLVLSALLMLPAAAVVAALIDIAGAVPPELMIGAVPVTPVTVPVLVVAPAAIPSNLVLSALVIRPAREVVAAGIVALVPVELLTVPVVAAVL